MKKILLIIIDGLGDEPIPRLKNKTPLEAANTPNLNFLVKNGICGLVKPFLFPKEKKPSSEGTHIALFGFKDYFLGRGPYEAIGVGIKMKKGDIAFRGNFATVNENLKVIDRRAGRVEKTQPLIKALKKIKIKGFKFLIKKSYGHRFVLVLRGKNLSPKISSNDPQKVGVKVKEILPLDKSRKSKITAQILNQFLEMAYQILKEHPFNKERVKKGLLPANYLLIRGAGKLKKTPTFKEKYNLKAAYIAGGALYKGIAKILGMKGIFVKGATGFANTNLKGKILAAKKGLKKYDFIFLHIKATDTFAEDGNFIGKMKFIEKIDQNLKPILNLKNTLIVVTGDHSTSSLLKKHCKREIPILIYGDGKDGVEKFSEKECQKGKLGKIRQIDLIEKILEYAKM
jgi:2,3-bisphosphoglycerate-independent phosphoglycerate mutase